MKEVPFCEIRELVIQMLNRNELIPIVGSGISCGSPTKYREVPSGAQMKAQIIDVLKSTPDFEQNEIDNFTAMNFSQLCGLFFDEDIIPADMSYSFLEANFADAMIEDERKKFFEIDWPYIYSLNIDDSIEKSTRYSTVILPSRHVKDDIFKKNYCLIKLHGDIKEILTYHDARKIFTTKDYAVSIQENSYLLSKLYNDYCNLNIVFIGCSLDDEIDLTAIDAYKSSIVPQKKANRIFFFTTDAISLTKRSKLKSYGITDIVIFKSHEQIYRDLYSAWEESQKIPKSSIDEYANMSISQIKDDPKQDREYLLFGKSPFRGHGIILPSFYINRSHINGILDKNKMPQKHLYFIKGSRISGKTYFLINLYNLFPGYKRLFFGNEIILNDEAFSTILEISGAVIFFDTNTLSVKQLERILEHLHSTNNHFFIVSGKGNTSLESTIINAIDDRIINKEDISLYDLSTVFDKSELAAINKLLPNAYLPPFQQMSIIDNIIDISDQLNQKARLSGMRLKILNTKDLAFLILLATHKSLTTLNLVEFDISESYYVQKNYYSPLIDEIKISRFEKNGADMSSHRIILNAPIWLYRSLGSYSIADDKIEEIAQAYKFLVERIIAISKGDHGKRRRLLRKLIFFETINSIFAKRRAGQKRLIHAIYETLRPTLANDYHFLHQSAKCDLWERAPGDRLKILHEALEKIVIAIGLAKQALNNSRSPLVPISIAHMEFTRATILSELVMLGSNDPGDNICKALDSIADAIFSQYNYSDTRDLIINKTPCRIIELLKRLLYDEKIASTLSADYKILFNRIWEYVRNMRSD